MSISNNTASASGIEIWSEAPHFPTWSAPHFYSENDTLYLCFDAIDDDTYSTVKFDGVIEFHIQPFTDESLGQHDFCKFGLKNYEFNIVKNSSKTTHWKVLNPKHWVITFKDQTVDVIAENCIVIATASHAKSHSSALLAAIPQHA